MQDDQQWKNQDQKPCPSHFRPLPLPYRSTPEEHSLFSSANGRGIFIPTPGVRRQMLARKCDEKLLMARVASYPREASFRQTAPRESLDGLRDDAPRRPVEPLEMQFILAAEAVEERMKHCVKRGTLGVTGRKSFGLLSRGKSGADPIRGGVARNRPGLDKSRNICPRMLVLPLGAGFPGGTISTACSRQVAGGDPWLPSPALWPEAENRFSPGGVLL